jgi:AmmeMemoRadiSam system protein A
VTLTGKADGQLRGCIGSILGDRPLVDGVIANAANAALHDPRFEPVTPGEEPGLHLEISVLTPLQPVPGPGSIVIGRDGVLLEKDGRRAVFLPQVAPEQGWDVETTLRHLSLKAGLGPDDWKEPGVRLQVFQAQVFEEAP